MRGKKRAALGLPSAGPQEGFELIGEIGAAPISFAPRHPAPAPSFSASVTMLTSGDSDDSSFFKPASSSTEHTHFTPQSFTHLTVWAYIAIGVIVVITSSVLCYAIYSCYQPLRDGNAIVIGETGFVYPPEHRDKARKRRPRLAFLRRHRKVQVRCHSGYRKIHATNSMAGPCLGGQIISAGNR